MGTEILRPDAAGTHCGIPGEIGCSACPDHFDCVYETTCDGVTTHVRNTTGILALDTYALPNSGVGAGVITSVKIYICVAASGEGCTIRPAILTNGVLHYGDGVDPNGDVGASVFNSYPYTWSDNPETGNPWTWDEIDALEAGCEITGSGAPGWKTAMCSQVYIEVDYTLPVVGGTPVPAVVALDLI